ncbi:MAG: tyrosine-type recombinase/integrase, partial [Oscillospiraceae bacterium]|nr:tyrosine-type recombinase/integrase [Oscillospiraceae bacterium]
TQELLCLLYRSFNHRILNRKGQKIYDPSTVNHAINQITESYNKAETENADKENRPPLLLPHLSPHTLRHSFASRAVESNAIPPKHLQTMLGHSSIQVTMDIYAEISDEALQNSMSAFDGI